MGKRRRTKLATIADPAARRAMYSKMRKGLFNEASELCRLTGARAAVVVFSPDGEPCSFGDPSIIDDGDGDGDGDGTPSPMSLTEWEEWAQTEFDGCTTEEELESLILKFEAFRDRVWEKLKASEDNTQVQIGGEAVRHCAQEKLKASEDDSQVQVGAEAVRNCAQEKLKALEDDSQVQVTHELKADGVDVRRLVGAKLEKPDKGESGT
ncbi:hypothetical protein BT93_E1439 [Corymbia citriodora subsp. variegata]|nr:hypothetical protein BT93_E1439 [Corymbia citriodora subsp. variegata]